MEQNYIARSSRTAKHKESLSEEVDETTNNINTIICALH